MSGHRTDNPPGHRVGAATQLFLLMLIATCVAFGAWAYHGELDIVSLATGEVVPSSQVKSVQHLEGGIVREILVKEGDRVTKDQALVVLESTSSGADVRELEIRTTGLRVEAARLEAEVSGRKTPEFDAALAVDHPKLVREARALFDSRKRRQQSQITGQKEVLAQRRADVREIRSRIENAKKGLKLLREQIAISDNLLKDNLTNRYTHLDLLKEANGLKGHIKESTTALRRAEAAVKEATAQIESLRSAFKAEASQELEEARQRLRELTQRSLKYKDNLKRTVLRSPVEGVVKTMHVFTRGGVVKAGASVVDIVPAGDRLVIEAKLPTQDIGYVRPGQPATVKLASADAVRFGNLDGEVVVISPDTLVNEQGVPFYKVRIQVKQGYFERGDLRYQLFPGMQVATSIRTGKRTVLEYLLYPFLGSLEAAMQER